MSFTVADFKDELIPESSEGYFGTYNYYAKTLDESGEKLTSSRDYLGQIVLSDSDYPDSEPDEDGIKSEYVTVNGLVPFAETFGLKENTTFEYYDGLLYTGTAGGSYGQDTKYGLYTYMYHMDATAGKYYDANLVGGFVEDGYLAFVNLYASQGLNITALALVAFGDAELTDYQGEFDIFNDILLVKPDKDDSGLAPKPETSSFKLNLVRKALAKGPTNLVETPSGNFGTIVDQVRNLPNVCGQFTGIQGERDAKAVSFSSEFSSEKVQKPSKNDPYAKVANISLR
jgi:hypothetical protein